MTEELWGFWVPVTGRWQELAAREKWTEWLVERAGGFTVLGEAYGYWLSPEKGRTVKDVVEIWAVKGLTEEDAHEFAEWVRRELDQESVLYGRVSGEWWLAGSSERGITLAGRTGGSAVLTRGVELLEDAQGQGAGEGLTGGEGRVHHGREGDRAYSAVDSAEGEDCGLLHRAGVAEGYEDAGIVAAITMGAIGVVMGGIALWEALWGSGFLT